MDCRCRLGNVAGMRVFIRMAALATYAALILMVAGCSGYPDRRIILNELSPALMSNRAYAGVVGTYTGPVRSTTQRGGFEGESTIETRLDLSGWADAPQVALKMDTGFSTAWAMYGERKGLYTNIPSRRYGSQGDVYASTHAPNQMLLKMHRFGASAGTGAWVILTFQDDGVIDVDWIGHSGWRGSGELWRVPAVMRAD
jgi:hypothetical protein